MTLIAFAANTKSADIITDTLSYGPALSSMGHATKAHALTHIDTVVLTQGDSAVGWALTTMTSALSDEAPDFDAMVEIMPEAACATWETVLADRDDEVTDSTCFLIGYSAADRSFAAYGFASEQSFRPFKITGLHVMPSPLSMRPSDLELGRMERAGVHPDDLQVLRKQPTAPPPPNVSQWVALGRYTRENRFGCTFPFKVAVAGHLMHTHISRGRVTTKKVHTFDDAGEEFQRMVAGTYHPQSQLGPCTCDSGKRYLDCHLVEHASEACLCGSGVTFGECCSLAATPDVAVV